MKEIIFMLFNESFLTRALLAGLMISLCSALLGVSLVLKKFSMIGDGLSHVSFGAMAIAMAANVAPLTVALPVVVVCSFLLIRMNEKAKIKGDVAIALLSTGALAVGVMVTSMTTGMNVDIYNYMFGSILTMKNSDVVITAILTACVVSLFVIFYDEIFAVTFDESFAKATGTRVSFYNMLIAALIAVTIVIGMRMMGALLISSLIIFPSVTSMRISKSYRNVIISSCLVSVFCFISGLIFSVKYEAPTGASVVVINIFVLLFFTVLHKIRNLNKSAFKCLKAVLYLLTIIVFIGAFIFTFFAGDIAFTNSKKDKPSIVATAFAQYDFARQLAGDNADVVMLLSPGEESHTFEPTPSDIAAIKNCDLFIYGGGESDKWVDTILEASDETIKTVKMIDAVELHKEDHNDDEEHEHSHEEYDEHVWTSPENAILISEAICNALCEIDEENAEVYISNLKAYSAELNNLSNSFVAAVSESKGNKIAVGDRFPMKYFCEEYEIEYYAAFPGCSAQVETNPVTIAKLKEYMLENDITTVFKVDLSTGLVAETVSEVTNAEVATLYSCHVISAEDFENGETYISLMERNLAAIKNALSH